MGVSFDRQNVHGFHGFKVTETFPTKVYLTIHSYVSTQLTASFRICFYSRAAAAAAATTTTKL